MPTILSAGVIKFSAFKVGVVEMMKYSFMTRKYSCNYHLNILPLV